EARAAALPQIGDGDLEVSGPAAQLRIVGEARGRLGDDHRRLAHSFFLGPAERRARGGGVAHARGTVDSRGDRLDLLLESGFQKVEGTVVAAALRGLEDRLRELEAALSAMRPDLCGAESEALFLGPAAQDGQ